MTAVSTKVVVPGSAKSSPSAIRLNATATTPPQPSAASR